MIFRNEKNFEITIKNDKSFENKIKNKELFKDNSNESNKNIYKESLNKKSISFGSLSERKLFFDNKSKNSFQNIVKQIQENFNYDYNKEIENSKKSFNLKDNTTITPQTTL